MEKEFLKHKEVNDHYMSEGKRPRFVKKIKKDESIENRWHKSIVYRKDFQLCDKRIADTFRRGGHFTTPESPSPSRRNKDDVIDI